MQFTVPKGFTIEAVVVITGVGHFSYLLNTAIKQGHIKPINVSAGRYEAVVKGAAQAIKITLMTCRQ